MSSSLSSRPRLQLVLRPQPSELARLIDAGRLRPVVDAVFPLEQAREAYRHRPQRGKVVLRMDER